MVSNGAYHRGNKMAHLLSSLAYPYHPWDWYIYLHLVVFNGKIPVNVGKYTSPMDGMGYRSPIVIDYHLNNCFENLRSAPSSPQPKKTHAENWKVQFCIPFHGGWVPASWVPEATTLPFSSWFCRRCNVKMPTLSDESWYILQNWTNQVP